MQWHYKNSLPKGLASVHAVELLFNRGSSAKSETETLRFAFKLAQYFMTLDLYYPTFRPSFPFRASRNDPNGHGLLVLDSREVHLPLLNITFREIQVGSLRY